MVSDSRCPPGLELSPLKSQGRSQGSVPPRWSCPPPPPPLPGRGAGRVPAEQGRQKAAAAPGPWLRGRRCPPGARPGLRIPLLVCRESTAWQRGAAPLAWHRGSRDSNPCHRAGKSDCVTFNPCPEGRKPTHPPIRDFTLLDLTPFAQR